MLTNMLRRDLKAVLNFENLEYSFLSFIQIKASAIFIKLIINPSPASSPTIYSTKLWFNFNYLSVKNIRF